MTADSLLIPNARLRTRDRVITVPVDWENPSRFGTLQVFAREVVDPAKDSQDLPLLLFLQGGPGGSSPRPMGGGWLAKATATHRVVLLDQRGTGRSSPITPATLAQLSISAGTAARIAAGTAPGLAVGKVAKDPTDPSRAADYAACFRADSIIRDAEQLRTEIYGGRQWETLGQSYGGFLTLTYLSQAPHALKACYVTAGIPGITTSAEDVYRATFATQLRRNAQFRAAYPEDGQLLDTIADLLESEDIRLPDGDQLTVRRLQTLGMSLGMGTGADSLHWLLDTAFDTAADGSRGTLSAGFLAAVGQKTDYSSNPLYMMLHETIYHQGAREPGWAAQRVVAELGAYDPAARPLQLTGEGTFPWMFTEFSALRPFGPVAEDLAAQEFWPNLYDVDRLASNEVPVAAVQYVADPFVDLGLAQQTAAQVGNLNLWITNEYLHDGLRADGNLILGKLFDLVSGRTTVHN